MDSVFHNELEKQIWIATYTRYEPNGAEAKQRAKRAWEMVLELRESQTKLLAFGDWADAAKEIIKGG